MQVLLVRMYYLKLFFNVVVIKLLFLKLEI